LGGYPPTPPARGALPPCPPFCPPSWAEGLPGFWAPLVGGSLMGATRPLLRFFGGTSPKPPAMGASPPWTPQVSPPSWAEGLPGFWAPLVGRLLMWATRSILRFFGGTSPKPPARGLRPLHPRFNQGQRRPTSFKKAGFSRHEMGGNPGLPKGQATCIQFQRRRWYGMSMITRWKPNRRRR